MTDDAVTAAWVTERLRLAGVLPQGRAISVQQHGNDAFNSLVVHLNVLYSEDAPDDAPDALLLKRAQGFAGEREIAFYREILSGGTGETSADGLPMIPNCYDAALDPRSGASHLLLADASATHRPPVTRTALLAGNGVPSRSQLDAMMSVLAMFHATWWDDPRLGGEGIFGGRWYADRRTLEEHVRRRENEWVAASDDGEPIPADLRRLYEEALQVLERAWDAHLTDRVSQRRHMTLTHGDCYFTQWLCPDDDSGPTYLIDFDSVSANVGAFDLAFLLPTFWTPTQRSEHERYCLRRYYDGLNAAGVEDYGWEELVMDYRWMIAFMVFDPIFDRTNGSSRTYWFPKMQNLTAAYRDWDCGALGR